MNSRKPTQLQVSTYDRTNGFLVASIILWSFLVTVLFVIWLTHVPSQKLSAAPRFEPGMPFKATKVTLETDNVDVVDLPVAAAPQLTESLEAIPDIVSKMQGAISTQDSSTVTPDSNGNRTGPQGTEDGAREPGYPEVSMPLYKRWSMEYEYQNFDEYVAALNSLQTELGIVHLTTNEIVRLRYTDDAWSKTVSSRKGEAKSFYFAAVTASTKRWDRKIARDNGVDFKDSTFVHFYSQESLEILHMTESARANEDGYELSDIKHTKFRVVRINGGLQFEIAEIEYR